MFTVLGGMVTGSLISFFLSFHCSLHFVLFSSCFLLSFPYIHLLLFALFLSFSISVGIRDSSVVITIGYGLNGSGSIPGRGKSFFSTLQCSDRLWGHSDSYPMGTGGSFPSGIAADRRLYQRGS
jgi:hypothetical protein